MKEKWSINIWKNGKYLDFWHVNHFLAGPVCLGVIFLLNIPIWSGFILSVMIMLGWEVYEIKKTMRHPNLNLEDGSLRWQSRIKDS